MNKPIQEMVRHMRTGHHMKIFKERWFGLFDLPSTVQNKLNMPLFALRKEIAVVLFLCQLLVISPAFGNPEPGKQDARLESGGYEYEYQSDPVYQTTSKELMYYTGRIAVTRIANQQVIYEENDTFPPGMCSGFPAISKLLFKVPVSRLLGGNPKEDRELIVLCGSNSGRHKTIKVFFDGPMGLRVTALDFENTRPNISAISGGGIYESVVYRRVMFDDVEPGYAVTPYMFVYALNVDDSSYGFSTQFGQGVARHYLGYYKNLYKSLSSASEKEVASDYIGPMISALFATKDKDTICREIRTLANEGVQLAVMREWATRLPKAGYPYFDLNICEEK